MHGPREQAPSDVPFARLRPASRLMSRREPDNLIHHNPKTEVPSGRERRRSSMAEGLSLFRKVVSQMEGLVSVSGAMASGRMRRSPGAHRQIWKQDFSQMSLRGNIRTSPTVGNRLDIEALFRAGTAHTALVNSD